MFFGSFIGKNEYRNLELIITRKKVRIFKPSWGKSRWLHAALTGTHHVQIVAPELPLWLSGKIRMRNRATVCRLKERGFENVQVFFGFLYTRTSDTLIILIVISTNHD